MNPKISHLDPGSIDHPRRHACRALVAQGPRLGALLEYEGVGITEEVEEAGVDDLACLGLDDAPEGLSIWEGDFVFEDGFVEGYREPSVGSWTNRGAFRALTSEEWQRLRQGQRLFDHEGNEARAALGLPLAS